MLDKLVHDELLSPLLPPNATLSSASDKEFRTLMEEWTESAMKAPFVR